MHRLRFPVFVLKEDSALALLVRVTALAFMASLALSWPLYLQHHRIFAPSPLIAAFAGTPLWLEWGLLFTQGAMMLWLLAQPLRRFPALAACGIMVFWVLQDLLRLQPYIYLYGFTFLFAALRHADRRDGLRALRLMVAGVYFWAGFHKLNMTFFFDVFPWFIEPLHVFPATPKLADYIFMGLGFATPFFEMAIGLLLPFRRTRRVATVMAFVMLLAVLFCLGPLGHDWNSIVLPWNVQLFAAEFLLFAQATPAPVAIRRRGDVLWWAAFLLFIAAPPLSLAGLWAAYPSFRLYSGNIASAAVILAPDEPLERLPKGLGKLAAGGILPLSAWTSAEFNVLVYPEDRVFIHGAQGICPWLADPWGAQLSITMAPPFYTLQKKSFAVPLCEVAQTPWNQ